jgi:hypothetical protein
VIEVTHRAQAGSGGDDGSLYGFVDDYLSPKTREPRSGSVCVNPGPDDLKYNHDTWTLESESPLTLSPSLL